MPLQSRSIFWCLFVTCFSYLSGCSRESNVTYPEPFVATVEEVCEAPGPEVHFINDIYLGGFELDPVFLPEISNYNVNVPYLVDSLSLRPEQFAVPFTVAIEEIETETGNINKTRTVNSISVSIAGEAIPEGEVSAPISLQEGSVTEVELLVTAVVSESITCGTADRVVTSVDMEDRYTVSIFRSSLDDFQGIGLNQGANSVGESDGFGSSISLSDDHIVVGVYRDDGQNDLALDSGAAYIFERGMTDPFVIRPTNSEAGDNFGFSVSVDGDFVAVSAPKEDSSSSGINSREDDNLAPDSGAVYIYQRQQNQNVWEQHAYIKPPFNVGGIDGFNDAFGHRVFLKDGVLLISAPKEDSASGGATDSSVPNSGAVYVYGYDENTNTWSYSTILKQNVAREGDAFGSTISSSGSVIAVGAPNNDSSYRGALFGGALTQEPEGDDPRLNNDSPNSGAVYLFTALGTQTAYIKAPNSDLGDQFGASLSLWEGQLLIGAPFEDGGSNGFNRDLSSNSKENSGAAYLYDLSGDNVWVNTMYIKPSISQLAAKFGASVDIYANTLLVGAPGFDSQGFADIGSAYLFKLVNNDWRETTSFEALVGNVGAGLGSSVALSLEYLALGLPGLDNDESGITLQSAGGIDIWQ